MGEQENQLGDFASGLEWITSDGQEHRAYQAIQQGDFEKARRLLEPVAARNSVYSLLTLGGFYEWGNLGPPDMNVAISYYQRAASLGSVEACWRLGRLLLDHATTRRRGPRSSMVPKQGIFPACSGSVR